MSESRAKRERKENASQVVPVKKNNSDKVINLVLALVIVVVAAIGGYAAYGKIKKERELNAAAQQAMQDAQNQVATVADIAAEKGITVEELLAKTGLEASGLTAESTETDLFGVMTLEGYAKFMDEDVAELKKKFGIEKLDNGMLWQEAQLQITMAKVAEVEYEISFEEFAMQQGLPAEITGETTFGEALEIMQAQQAAAAPEAEATAPEAPATEAPAESTAPKAE